MKAIITGKSQLKWPSLTREYTFNILSDDDEEILTSQVIEAFPSEIRSRLDQIITEYQAAFEEASDVEVGEEI